MVLKSTITQLSAVSTDKIPRSTARGRRRTRPSSNFRLQNGCYLLSIAAPGYRRENFDVRVIGNIIRIKASKSASPLCSFAHCEYDFTNWQRSFVLPDDADPILATAKYQNGELSIILSRKDNNEPEEGEFTIYVY